MRATLEGYFTIRSNLKRFPLDLMDINLHNNVWKLQNLPPAVSSGQMYHKYTNIYTIYIYIKYLENVNVVFLQTTLFGASLSL